MIKLLKSMSVQKSFPIPNFIMGLAVWASIFDGSSRNKKMLAKNVLESDVLSLELAWLLSRYWDFGREIALGILAFGIQNLYYRSFRKHQKQLRKGFRRGLSGTLVQFEVGPSDDVRRTLFVMWLVSRPIRFVKKQDVCLRIILLEINKLHAHLGICLQITDRNQM